MACLKVEGGSALEGCVRVQGSKNAALPIMAAAILNRGITTLFNVPQIADVDSMKKILEFIGCNISFQNGIMKIDAKKITGDSLPWKQCSQMRSSVMLLGPMLARIGVVKAYHPGGCLIGKRPIDIHLNGLTKMGASVREQGAEIDAVAEELFGVEINLAYPSVGATENLIMAAAGADGATTLFGYAKEPEIQELCNYLRLLGITVEGFGSPNLTISGSINHKDVEYCICGDRIVAGTYLCACFMCGGRIYLENAPTNHLDNIRRLLNDMGAVFWKNEIGLGMEASGEYGAIPYLATGPYPGFPTDLQSPMLAVLALARGTSVIEENVFEDRFHVAKELQKMGAEIIIENNHVKITGVERLSGTMVEAKDLRGGAALTLAGLAAHGTTSIYGYSHIQRGYENLVEDACKLGGKIYQIE